MVQAALSIGGTCRTGVWAQAQRSHRGPTQSLGHPSRSGLVPPHVPVAPGAHAWVQRSSPVAIGLHELPGVPPV